LTAANHNESDRDEILRQFESGVKDDMASLRGELRLAKLGSVLTKDVVATVIVGAASLIAPHVRATAKLGQK